MIPELSLWFVRTDECPNNLRARLSPHRITIWNVCFTCLLACLLALLTHTHTHLLRTVIANSVVECILPAKTLLPLHLTGSRCYHRQSQCIWNQIVEETGSIWKKTDCCSKRAGLDKKLSKLSKMPDGVLGLALCHVCQKLEWRKCRYTRVISPGFHHHA